MHRERERIGGGVCRRKAGRKCQASPIKCVQSKHKGAVPNLGGGSGYVQAKSTKMSPAPGRPQSVRQASPVLLPLLLPSSIHLSILLPPTEPLPTASLQLLGAVAKIRR